MPDAEAELRAALSAVQFDMDHNSDGYTYTVSRDALDSLMHEAREAREKALREAAEAAYDSAMDEGLLRVEAASVKQRILALSAIPAAGDSAEGWQKIETAPKDGRAVLLLTAPQTIEYPEEWNEPPTVHAPRCAIGAWDAEGTSWVNEDGIPSDEGVCTLAVTGIWLSGGGWFQPNEVTHWQPLPPPPASSTQEVGKSADVILALWQAWNELNAIRARDGVPWWSTGRSDVDPAYFSKVVDDCEAAIEQLTGEPPKPWPPEAGRSALSAMNRRRGE